MLAFDGDTLAGVLCFEIRGERIAAVRNLANPDKLRFLAEQLSLRRPARFIGNDRRDPQLAVPGSSGPRRCPEPTAGGSTSAFQPRGDPTSPPRRHVVGRANW